MRHVSQALADHHGADEIVSSRKTLAAAPPYCRDEVGDQARCETGAPAHLGELDVDAGGGVEIAPGRRLAAKVGKLKAAFSGAVVAEPGHDMRQALVEAAHHGRTRSQPDRIGLAGQLE